MEGFPFGFDRDRKGRRNLRSNGLEKGKIWIWEFGTRVERGFVPFLPRFHPPSLFPNTKHTFHPSLSLSLPPPGFLRSNGSSHDQQSHLFFFFSILATTMCFGNDPTLLSVVIPSHVSRIDVNEGIRNQDVKKHHRICERYTRIPLLSKTKRGSRTLVRPWRRFHVPSL